MSNLSRSLLLASPLFAVAVHGQDASLDPSFSGNGYTVDLIEGIDDRPNSIAVQDDGKIVVCGTRVAFQDNHMLVARYTAAGALDVTFSGDGKLVVPIGFITNNTGEAVLIQPDGSYPGRWEREHHGWPADDRCAPEREWHTAYRIRNKRTCHDPHEPERGHRSLVHGAGGRRVHHPGRRPFRSVQHRAHGESGCRRHGGCGLFTSR